jgi:hypothetical protein
MSGNLDELPGQLAQLRELVREAHGATKDLRTAIREAKDYADSLVKLVDAAADAARRAAYAAGCEQVRELEAHLQAEMNRSAADLNAAVQVARDHISKALMPKVASVLLDGDDDLPSRLLVTFEGGLFDANPGAAARSVPSSVPARNGTVSPRDALRAADRSLRGMDELMATVQHMRAQMEAEVRDYRDAMRRAAIPADGAP